jgi:hypothetical protein
MIGQNPRRARPIARTPAVQFGEDAQGRFDVTRKAARE